MNIFKLVLVLSTFVFLVSCDSATEPVEIESQLLMPLKVGNEWTYTDTNFEDSKVTVEDFRYLVTRLEDVNIGYKQYKAFVLTGHNSKNEQVVQEFFTCNSIGLYTYGSENDPFNLLYRDLLLKYPVSVNERWNTYYHYFTPTTHRFSHDTCIVECLSIKEQITVPAGTFKCVKYQYTLNTGAKAIENWSESVGMISYQRFDKEGKLEESSVLKRRNFN